MWGATTVALGKSQLTFGAWLQPCPRGMTLIFSSGEAGNPEVLFIEASKQEDSTGNEPNSRQKTRISCTFSCSWLLGVTEMSGFLLASNQKPKAAHKVEILSYIYIYIVLYVYTDKCDSKCLII